MSTDTLTERDPFTILTAVLDKANAGDDWTVDDWREEAALAGLRGDEIVRAHKQAARAGYLLVLGESRPSGFCHYSRASTHPASKGRPVQVYERTAKRISGEGVELPGQAELFEVP